MRDSLDDEEIGYDQPPAYDPISRSRSVPSASHRDDSPLPAPKPQKPVVPPRESLDGDTIFAVGEDDKWSDDEVEPASPGNGDERQRLTSSRKDD